MKKLIIVTMIAMGMFSLSACGNKKEETKPSVNNENKVEENDNTSKGNLEGTLPEIIDKIYENVETNLNLITMELDLTDLDGLPYYTGLSEASKIKEAAVSESAFGSQAYSLVLVRLNDAKDAEDVADTMLNNIDTRKWICANADDVRVAAYGDTVMFIMTSTEFEGSASAKDITEAFEKVCGNELAVDKAK